MGLQLVQPGEGMASEALANSTSVEEIKEVKARFFTAVYSKRTRDNRHKLKVDRFRLGIGRNVFLRRTV